MQRLGRLLARWPVALVCVIVLGAAVLLPGLDSFGLWEPQERQLADKAAPRDGIEAKTPALPTPTTTPPPPDACARSAPKDAVARTLTTRAAAWGRDTFGDSDGGRRLPLALLGLMCMLAAAGTAMRIAGARAGVVTALVMLSMPLLVLQSRQLTSEIGTAAGGALVIYGLVSLGRARLNALGAIDNAVSIIALVGGIAIGFVAGGALLGVLVPIGAYAAAGGLGAPLVRTIATTARPLTIKLLGAINPRWAAGRSRDVASLDTPLGDQLKAFVATLAAIAVLGVLVYQVFALREPQPGLTPPQRALFGHAIVPDGCWSWALGGIWKPEDDLRYVFDSTFEQIAYGTFPWGVLAPIAVAALLASADRGRRQLGALALAWAGAAWIASEVFQRKVGFSLWAGFPALAIAVGTWLDALIADRKNLPPGAKLIGLFFLLAVLDLGKDLQSFTVRLTSLLVGGDAVPYPTMSRVAFVPTQVWVLILGLVIALGFAVAVIAWRREGDAWLRYPVFVALGGTIVIAAFWAFSWQPALAEHLSSKAMFDTFLDLRKPGDQLVVMGDLGDAAHDYAPEITPEVFTTREQIVTSLGRPNRVFAISPQTELCQLHREVAGKPYFVIDDRNLRSLLLSNKVDGTTDKNPLRTTILHAEPKDIRYKPKSKIVWDGRIQLLGWDIPKVVGRGAKFDVTMYYKILQPPGGSWTVLAHYDGPNGLRFNGDHAPIDGRCATSTWQPGDFIVDTHTVTAGGVNFAKASYDLWTGFFTGTNPNWKNMPVSEAPGDLRDNADRVKITTIALD